MDSLPFALFVCWFDIENKCQSILTIYTPLNYTKNKFLTKSNLAYKLNTISGSRIYLETSIIVTDQSYYIIWKGKTNPLHKTMLVEFSETYR